MKNNELIKLNGILKTFGNSKALDNVSFSIPKNSIFGLLGPNGSGKSTLMRILSGLIIKWSGEIFFENQNIKLNQKYFLQKCGFLIEDPTFYEYLSARQNLSLLARLSNCDDLSIENVLTDVDLLEDADRKVGDFSYGMKQRLGIAQAILHDPDILFLDEPNNGLDPLGIKEMNKTILKLNEIGKTVCVSTHILNDVEELCSDVVILKEGKLIHNSSMEYLIDQSKEIVIRSKKVDNITKYLRKSNLCKIKSLEKEKIIIETNLNLNEVSQLIPKNLIVRSIAKEPNLADLFK